MEVPSPTDRVRKLYLDLTKKALTASLYEESAWSIIHAGTPGEAVPKLIRPLGVFLRDVVVRFLRRHSLLIVRQRPFREELRDAGTDWPLFGYTMAGTKRLENVQFCVEDVLRNNVQGDFIETGVWRGGTTIFFRALLKAYEVTDRTVWVADSFEGLPPPVSKEDGWDMSQVDYLKVSLEQVKANFDRFGLLDEQVRFLPGWFKNTLPTAPIGKLAIIRLDGDLYSSTMDALQSLYHKLNKGGYVIVDDYNVWPGCKRAVHDFLDTHSLTPNIQSVDGFAAFWKV